MALDNATAAIGRTKMPEEMRAAFRELTPLAIENIKRTLSVGQNEKDRLKAAEIVLDRAWGRVPSAPEDLTAIEGSARPLAGLTPEALVELLKAK
jgi:hypothetical protein